ncbi:GDP-mannose 4,6-dehydratase [bacterium]|nr:GDP-mannose 4,6-dehydratase [bacterium]
MRILITGMEGFVGSHLAEYALAKKAEVHGTALPGAGLDNLQAAKAAKVHRADITDAKAVARLVAKVRPRWIFHLAGQSSPSHSRQAPDQTLQVNVLGNLHVLEAARRLDKHTRVLVVGSADEYGSINPPVMTIRETHPLNPETPYAVSKVCQDLMGRAYFKNYGLQVIRTRPFNHIGPRQARGFVAADFSYQIAMIEKGRQASMQVGNTEVIRDFSDVRDIVAGYWSLLESGKPGEVYNLGSGKGITVSRLLEILIALSSLKIKVNVQQSKIRNEKKRKVGSIAKVARETGWKPKMKLRKTLENTLDYWRGQVK